MNSLPSPLVRGAFLCLVGAVAGCNVVPPAQEDPTRYYLLSDSAPNAARAGQPQDGVRVGLRAIRLAGYLNHRDIVVRTGTNEVEFRDFRRWAEPLDTAVARVLRSKLLAAPSVSQAWLEPFPGDENRDFDVTVELTRCEGAASPKGGYVARLSATFKISTAGANPHVVARGTFVAPDEAWDGANFDRLAALLSADVEALGQEILADIPARN